jgi:hypothetical protein
MASSERVAAARHREKRTRTETKGPGRDFAGPELLLIPSSDNFSVDFSTQPQSNGRIREPREA